MKRKKRSYRTLKNALDGVFSEWVRRSAADLHGYVRCVCCGAVKPWNDGMHAGHFVSRVHLATRWEPRNVHPVCSTCNVLRRGNMVEYASWMSHKYGPGIVDELLALKRSTVKYTRTDLGGILEEYKRRIADLDQRAVGEAGGKKVGDNSLRLHGETIDTP